VGQRVVLLEAAGAHGTKETMRLRPLKGPAPGLRDSISAPDAGLTTCYGGRLTCNSL
jgi:hypothetical protein